MRFLFGSIAIFIALVVIAVAWLGTTTWGDRRKAKVQAMSQEWTNRRANEMYLGYDAAIDSIERLLAQDESRLFLTPDEQIELRAHIERWNNLQGA